MITRIFSSLILVMFFLISITADVLPQQQNVTINFSNMSPHLNQSLSLRVVDKSSLKETGRAAVLISAASFSVTLPAVDIGGSYFVDFFADHNSNGRYDPPPTDHAWRMELNNALGNDTLSFTHNTNFTNIKWQNILTINFSGMTPHIGQMLEIKLENSITEKEIGRIKIPAVASASFPVQIIGLTEPGDYSVEFYADHNGNGIYNVPPVDHAWKVGFNYTGGNADVSFSHNATFTDIQWKYLLTVNFASMTPHVGQLFELRVVKVENQEEVGRYTLPAILVPNYSVFVPGFDLNKDYNIDFYADHNGNGSYNAPPVDHAWRLTFNSSIGDVTSAFSHNANFIDIQWPGTTAVDDEMNIPVDFALSQNHPNPFNPSTTISFTLTANQFVTLKIFNSLGEEISTLVNDNLTQGSHSINFNSNGLSSGLYLYRLESGSQVLVRKMMLLK
jgi:Secretion system C-terminal sorting domain